MNITSNNTMIFRKEDNGKTHYRAGLSTKKQDNSYDKAYIDVRMPRGVELADRTKINITKGFLSFYYTTNQEDKKIAHWYIMIQEFTTASDVKEEKQNDEYENIGTQITVEDIDDMPLPF